MRVTQGAFSFLPDLTDQQIQAQVEYCFATTGPVSVEYTDDIHPRNTYWRCSACRCSTCAMRPA